MPPNVETPVLFHRYVPSEPLSEFVGLMWYWQGYDLVRGRERLLPTGTVELVIDLASGRTADSVVCGTWSRPFLIERTQRDRLLGVHFKPGGAFPFLKFPFGALHNCDVTLDDLWGASQAGQLLNLLHDAQTIDAQFRILETWLMTVAVRPLRHHPAVSFALAEFQQRRAAPMVAALAEQMSMSHRRFIRRFQDEVGLTPKLFSGIQRFQRTLRTIHRSDHIAWSNIALSAGYYDQAHFIHDFLRFTDMTPTAYLSLRTEHINHLRIK